MDQFDARRPGALVHGGTFNGNPVAAAAGLATLRYLTPRALRRASTARRPAPDRGSAMHWVDRAWTRGSTGSPPSSRSSRGRRSMAATGRPQAALFLGLLVDGFHLAPRGMGAIALPATEADVDAVSDAIAGRLASMRGMAVGAH